MKNNKKYNFVGHNTVLLDAYDKVTGQTRFISDIKFTGMLIGKVLISKYPHAKILKIDTEQAEKIPGVKCILTGKNVEQNKWGAIVKDQYPLVVNKARYVGDCIAAVAAVNEDICDEALSKIKVDYEILPAVLNVFDAIKEGAPIIHEEFPDNINFHVEIKRGGNIDEAFEKADFILENEYISSREYHAYMETRGGISFWDKLGNLTIYAGTQTPSSCKKHYAQALNMPPDKIRIVQTFYGGGFGGKTTDLIHPLGALLSKYSGQPVRLVYTRQQDFEIGRHRVPMFIRIKTGWSKNGEFIAKDVNILADNGAYTYGARGVSTTAMYRIDALYKVKTVRAKMDLIYTNTIPTSGLRGYGNAQMHYALESHIDEVGEKMGIDPVKLRSRNVVTDGHTNIHGWKINSCEIKECMDTVLSKSTYFKKKRDYKNKNNDNSDIIKKGIGMATGMHVSGNSSLATDFEGASVLLRLSEEGRIFVFSNECDMGQGIRTVLAISVAEILNITLDKITIPDIDTNIVPYGLGIYGSRGTYMASSAAKQAALDLRKKIINVASTIMNKKEDELDMINNCIVWKKDIGEKISIRDVASEYAYDHAGLNILGQGFFKPKDVVSPNKDFYGNVSGGYSFGSNVAEVEVNICTGEVKLLNVWSAYDVGQPINPIAVEGQVFGGIIQGFGWALMEELEFNKEGKLINTDFLDYQIPTAKDIPQINNYFIKSFEPSSGYGAKGIGELASIPIVPAISNAIYNAVGIRLYELPFSPERILQAIKERRSCLQ
jgi:CO/xanthine dehydrogenase Mo-binding subunit